MYFSRVELIPGLSLGKEDICTLFCALGCVMLKSFGCGVSFTFTCKFCLLSTQNKQSLPSSSCLLIALGKGPQKQHFPCCHPG